MLPKINRLKLEKDFKKVFSRGTVYRTKSMTLRLKRTGRQISRFGFMISNRVAKKAVVRNRLRRQLSEIIRLNLKYISDGYDIVLIAGTGILERSFDELKQDLDAVFKKTGLNNSEK